MASIFDKRRLMPAQLVTVAERRFQDARALCDTEKNAHANGAQYLAGFVIEMLLKAQLMRRYPRVATLLPHEPMSDQDRHIWSLLYRTHELGEMVETLDDARVAAEEG